MLSGDERDSREGDLRTASCTTVFDLVLPDCQHVSGTHRRKSLAQRTYTPKGRDTYLENS